MFLLHFSGIFKMVFSERIPSGYLSKPFVSNNSETTFICCARHHVQFRFADNCCHRPYHRHTICYVDKKWILDRDGSFPLFSSYLLSIEKMGWPVATFLRDTKQTEDKGRPTNSNTIATAAVVALFADEVMALGSSNREVKHDCWGCALLRETMSTLP